MATSPSTGLHQGEGHLDSNHCHILYYGEYIDEMSYEDIKNNLKELGVPLRGSKNTLMIRLRDVVVSGEAQRIRTLRALRNTPARVGKGSSTSTISGGTRSNAGKNSARSTVSTRSETKQTTKRGRSKRTTQAQEESHSTPPPTAYNENNIYGQITEVLGRNESHSSTKEIENNSKYSQSSGVAMNAHDSLNDHTTLSEPNDTENQEVTDDGNELDSERVECHSSRVDSDVAEYVLGTGAIDGHYEEADVESVAETETADDMGHEYVHDNSYHGQEYESKDVIPQNNYENNEDNDNNANNADENNDNEDGEEDGIYADLHDSDSEQYEDAVEGSGVITQEEVDVSSHQHEIIEIIDSDDDEEQCQHGVIIETNVDNIHNEQNKELPPCSITSTSSSSLEKETVSDLDSMTALHSSSQPLVDGGSTCVPIRVEVAEDRTRPSLNPSASISTAVENVSEEERRIAYLNECISRRLRGDHSQPLSGDVLEEILRRLGAKAEPGLVQAQAQGSEGVSLNTNDVVESETLKTTTAESTTTGSQHVEPTTHDISTLTGIEISRVGQQQSVVVTSPNPPTDTITMSTSASHMASNGLGTSTTRTSTGEVGKKGLSAFTSPIAVIWNTLTSFTGGSPPSGVVTAAATSSTVATTASHTESSANAAEVPQSSAAPVLSTGTLSTPALTALLNEDIMTTAPSSTMSTSSLAGALTIPPGLVFEDDVQPTSSLQLRPRRLGAFGSLSGSEKPLVPEGDGDGQGKRDGDIGLSRRASDAAEEGTNVPNRLPVSLGETSKWRHSDSDYSSMLPPRVANANASADTVVGAVSSNREKSLAESAEDRVEESVELATVKANMKRAFASLGWDEDYSTSKRRASDGSALSLPTHSMLPAYSRVTADVQMQPMLPSTAALPAPPLSSWQASAPVWRDNAAGFPSALPAPAMSSLTSVGIPASQNGRLPFGLSGLAAQRRLRRRTDFAGVPSVSASEQASAMVAKKLLDTLSDITTPLNDQRRRPTSVRWDGPQTERIESQSRSFSGRSMNDSEPLRIESKTTSAQSNAPSLLTSQQQASHGILKRSRQSPQEELDGSVLEQVSQEHGLKKKEKTFHVSSDIQSSSQSMANEMKMTNRSSFIGFQSSYENFGKGPSQKSVNFNIPSSNSKNKGTDDEFEFGSPSSVGLGADQMEVDDMDQDKGVEKDKRNSNIRFVFSPPRSNNLPSNVSNNSEKDSTSTTTVSQSNTNKEPSLLSTSSGNSLSQTSKAIVPVVVAEDNFSMENSIWSVKKLDTVKCNVCLVQNPKTAIKCVACESPIGTPGVVGGKSAEESTGSGKTSFATSGFGGVASTPVSFSAPPVPTPGSGIGAGGFMFGNTSASAATPTLSGFAVPSALSSTPVSTKETPKMQFSAPVTTATAISTPASSSTASSVTPASKGFTFGVGAGVTDSKTAGQQPAAASAGATGFGSGLGSGAMSWSQPGSHQTQQKSSTSVESSSDEPVKSTAPSVGSFSFPKMDGNKASGVVSSTSAPAATATTPSFGFTAPIAASANAKDATASFGNWGGSGSAATQTAPFGSTTSSLGFGNVSATSAVPAPVAPIAAAFTTAPSFSFKKRSDDKDSNEKDDIEPASKMRMTTAGFGVATGHTLSGDSSVSAPGSAPAPVSGPFGGFSSDKSSFGGRSANDELLKTSSTAKLTSFESSVPASTTSASTALAPTLTATPLAAAAAPLFQFGAKSGASTPGFAFGAGAMASTSVLPTAPVFTFGGATGASSTGSIASTPGVGGSVVGSGSGSANAFSATKPIDSQGMSANPFGSSAAAGTKPSSAAFGLGSTPATVTAFGSSTSAGAFGTTTPVPFSVSRSADSPGASMDMGYSSSDASSAAFPSMPQAASLGASSAFGTTSSTPNTALAPASSGFSFMQGASGPSFGAPSSALGAVPGAATGSVSASASTPLFGAPGSLGSSSSSFTFGSTGNVAAPQPPAFNFSMSGAPAATSAPFGAHNATSAPFGATSATSALFGANSATSAPFGANSATSAPFGASMGLTSPQQPFGSMGGPSVSAGSFGNTAVAAAAGGSAFNLGSADKEKTRRKVKAKRT